MEQRLRDVVSAVKDSTAAVIAVIDTDGRFQGLIDIGNVRKYLLRTDLYDRMTVRSLMETAPAVLRDDEKMESVMRKFDSTGAWRLPVVDADSKYLGFISRSRLLMAYRQELKEISNED